MPEAGTRPPEGLPEDEPAAALAALQARGARRFDPVRFHFIETLAKRTMIYEGAARSVLDARLGFLLTEFAEAFGAARSGAVKLAKDTQAQFPEASGDLEQLLQAGDFAGLRALAVRLRSQARPSGLADLGRQLAGHAADADEVSRHGPAPADAPGELKSVTYFRRTWSRLSVDQTLSHSQAQAPENAGPLNSQHLVLRALKLMRDVSPEYVSRFMSHMDTLLWLEQATGAPAKNIPGRDADAKPKPKRRKAT